MMSLIQYVLLAVVFLGLAGCQNPNYSLDYLVEHPLLLKDEIEYCQSLANKTPAQAQRCETAMTAGATLMALLSERQQDPEKFGQRVIDNEVACVKARQAYQAAQQGADVKQLRGNELQEAHKKVAEAKQLYEDKRKEVKALLAVIGMNSPE